MRHSGTEETDPLREQVLIPGRMQTRRHNGLQTCRSGSSAAVERTVIVAAPTGAVRGYLCSRPWPPSPLRTDASRTAAAGVEPRAAYALVNGVRLGRRRATCKTVGSGYVGSNPTFATTSENGPLAGNSRLCGPFLLCPSGCPLVPP